MRKMSSIVDKIKSNMKKINDEFNIKDEKEFFKFEEEEMDDHTREI